ncbi:PREDICTED: uncharacterized protein LOC109166641 [Ipomoea nil]|uniref:uncharacterized protein LOC109166641 n=1 Tax=Ipomoea nil TaxID=35883 RepID=UPI000901B481|nr:PREDICTED: uncharacterized protein LOC109166641 [Ipomoea nil]
MFKFKDFGSLKAPGGVDCNELIDLIGRVVSIYELNVIQVNKKPQRLIDFVIEDCRESRLRVTLWDEHVDSVLSFYDVVLTDPLIVILQLCRERVTDDGEVKISSSYTATKILFNYECLEFFSFKERLIGSGSVGAMSIQNITVSSLKDIHDEKKVGQFWVFGEIRDIQQDWYFTSCRNKNCGKKLQQSEDKMYCKPCNKKWPDGIIKYKLVIDILDDDQDSELILWDNVCTPLLGVTASELKVKYSKEWKMMREYVLQSIKENKEVWLRKLADEKEFNENFEQGIEPLQAISLSNPKLISLDESTPEQQSLKRINIDCSSFSKTLKKPKTLNMVNDYGLSSTISAVTFQ